MNAVAVAQGVRLPAESTVVSTVHLLGEMKTIDLNLAVDLHIQVPQGIEKSKMQEIVDKAAEVKAKRLDLHVSVSLSTPVSSWLLDSPALLLRLKNSLRAS